MQNPLPLQKRVIIGDPYCKDAMKMKLYDKKTVHHNKVSRKWFQAFPKLLLEKFKSLKTRNVILK